MIRSVTDVPMNKYRKVPNHRAWCDRDGQVWEFGKAGWGLCPNSPLEASGRRQICMTTEDGNRVQRVRAQVVYETYHGPIPTGTTVDHKNDVPYDDRPSNLQLLTGPQNLKKSWVATPLRPAVGIIATHRDGTVLTFPSYAAAQRHFNLGSPQRIKSAVIRGKYASRSHSPLKDWLLKAA